MQMDRKSSSAQRLRAYDAVLRILVRQHQHRVADLDLRVSDPPARLRQTKHLVGIESPLIKLDRLRRAAQAEIRKYLVYFHHGSTIGAGHSLVLDKIFLLPYYRSIGT